MFRVQRRISKTDKTSIRTDSKIRLAARRRLMKRILRDGGIGPPPDEVRRLRTPRNGAVRR